MSIFGEIIDAGIVEEAAADTLRQWFLTYTRELELQLGLTQDSIPQPRSYTVATEIDRDVEDQLPAVVVVSPGISDEPKMEGDGSYRVTWSVGIGVFASAKDRSSTSVAIRRYCAIVRAIVLQKASLGGVASGTRWLDENYDDMDFDDGRTIGVGTVLFEVEVHNAVTRRGGPAVPTAPDPDEQPGSNWPVADPVTVTVKRREEV